MLRKEYIESLVKFISSNDIEKITDCQVYNDWAKSTNTIIKDSRDVQYLIEIIKDFKVIKKTKLSRLLL